MKSMELFYYWFSILGWFFLTCFIWIAMFLGNGKILLLYNLFNEMTIEFIITNIIIVFIIIYPLYKIKKGKGVRE